jgi:hypothetical protein
MQTYCISHVNAVHSKIFCHENTFFCIAIMWLTKPTNEEPWFLITESQKTMLSFASLATHMNHEIVLCDPYKNPKNLKRDFWTQSVIFDRKVWFMNAKCDFNTHSVI